jgi:flagellin
VGNTITGAGGAASFLRNLERSNAGVSRAIERLSTGKRINRPSDDPSGFVAAEELRGEISRLNSELKNVQRLRGAARLRESELAAIHDQLTEVQGLLHGSAGNLLSDAERQAYSEQIDMSLDAVERLRVQITRRGPTGVPQIDSTTPSKIVITEETPLNETVDSHADEALFSRAGLAAYEKYELDVRQTLAEDMLVTHTAALSLIEDADFAEEAANLAASQILTAGSLAAIGLSGRMAAEQIGELIEGVEEAGSAARSAATAS